MTPTKGVCKECGCTEFNACPEGCSWTDKSEILCAECESKFLKQCESKWLRFEITERKIATVVVGVYSKTQGSMLGVIGWYPRWRQYCFIPNPQTIFNADCLGTITNCIRMLMQQKMNFARSEI